MDAGSFRVAKTVPHVQRRVRGHGNVVVHRIGRALADPDMPRVFIRIDRLDLDSPGGLLHFDLDFVRERLRLVSRIRLYANCRRDFHLAA